MARLSRRRRLRVTVTPPPGRFGRVPGLTKWLEAVAPAGAAGDVTVAFVGDARMRALNRAFRGVDRATDVLSFPADAACRVRDGALGDIAIATGVARRQAARQGHSVATEVRVLALHGLLHLLGYDHETDNGRMARAEARLRRKGGLRDGLIARARWGSS